MEPRQRRAPQPPPTSDPWPWKEIVERAAWGVAIGSADKTTLEDMNPAFARMYGYSMDELRGRPIADLFAPELRAGLPALLDEVHRRGHIVFESLHVRRDGAVFPVEVDESVVKDEHGRILCRVAYVRDITAREAAQEALRRSEDAHRRLIAMAPDGIFVADLDGRYTDVNAAGCAMLGYSREEIVGKTITDLLPAEDAPRLAAEKEALLRGAVRIGEWRLRRKDGTFLPVEVSANILPDGRWQGFVRDIRARRAAEEARVRMAALVEYTEDAMCGATLDGTVLSWNPAAERMFGYRADEVVGRSIFDLLIVAGRKPQASEALARLGRGERLQSYETILRRKEGAPLTVSMTLAPIRDPAGRAIGFSAIARDVSDRMELQRLREEWVAVVAHDLRQPVGMIAMATEALARAFAEDITPEQARSIERIRLGAHRLDRMIEDLLDVSLIDARRIALAPRRLDLRELVHEAADRAASLTAGHPVHVESARPLPPVTADPARIEQVVSNLLSNAAKYGEPGSEIRVRVGTSGEDLNVSVTNRGKGIAAEEIPRIFDRFYRGPADVGRTAGVGLGLYLAKALVEAHGGRIWAESRPGAETTFHFTLPVAR